MAKHVIFHNTNGTVTILYATPSCKLNLSQLAERNRRGRAWDIIDTGNIPVDRTFRNAWESAPGNIRVDLPKAKNIAHDKRRVVRANRFAPLDIEATIPGKAAEAEEKRQAIRDTDAVLQINLDDAVNVSSLKALMVEGGLAE
jgi:hypothetical protein